MKKTIVTLIATTFTYFLVAQDIETRSLNIMDAPTSYERYAFLSNQNASDHKNDVALEQTTVVTPKHEKWMMVDYRTTGWENDYPEENKILKKAISHELDVHDMNQDQSDPDILIQYHIYDSEYKNDDRYITGVEDYEYAYTKKNDLMAQLDDGTVVMSVIDTEENKSVWEGFAYNAYDENDSYTERQQGLRKAADALMERFAADNS